MKCNTAKCYSKWNRKQRVEHITEYKNELFGKVKNVYINSLGAWLRTECEAKICRSGSKKDGASASAEIEGLRECSRHIDKLFGNPEHRWANFVANIPLALWVKR
jgi:hypothetical protein